MVLFTVHPLQLESLKMNPFHDLTKQEAQAIATKLLHDSRPEAQYEILQNETMERDFGWVFFYAPHLYLVTRDPRYLVPGAGPLVILRKNGTPRFLPTSVPPLAAVREFERRWRSGQF